MESYVSYFVYINFKRSAQLTNQTNN